MPDVKDMLNKSKCLYSIVDSPPNHLRPRTPETKTQPKQKNSKTDKLRTEQTSKPSNPEQPHHNTTDNSIKQNILIRQTSRRTEQNSKTEQTATPTTRSKQIAENRIGCFPARQAGRQAGAVPQRRTGAVADGQ